MSACAQCFQLLQRHLFQILKRIILKHKSLLRTVFLRATPDNRIVSGVKEKSQRHNCQLFVVFIHVHRQPSNIDINNYQTCINYTFFTLLQEGCKVLPSVHLSAFIYIKNHMSKHHFIFCTFPMAMAQSSSDDSTISYVIMVLFCWHHVFTQICRSSLILSRNVRWPSCMLPHGESQWVCQRNRETDGRTPDCNIKLFARCSQRNNGAKGQNQGKCYVQLSLPGGSISQQPPVCTEDEVWSPSLIALFVMSSHCAIYHTQWTILQCKKYTSHVSITCSSSHEIMNKYLQLILLFE